MIDRYEKQYYTGRATRFGLSEREHEVLMLVAEGLTNCQIGERLSLSPLTIKSHVCTCMIKLDAASRTRLVAEAIRQRIIK